MFNFSLFVKKARNNAGISGLRTGIKTIVLILVVVCSLIGMAPIPASAAGTTYFVNKTVSCSDSSSNTAVQPFCTIGKAASVAVAGDTVSVVAGSYAETVSPTYSGTAGNPITYSAAPGVIVTGDGTSSGSAFRVTGLSYITINGFTVQDTAEAGIYVTGSNFIISNNTVTNTTSWGIYAPSSTNVTISNNTVSYAGKVPPAYVSGIYLASTSASTVNGNKSFNNTADGIRLSTCHDVTVRDNSTYANNAVNSSDGNGIALINTSYSNTVLHNKVYANRDTGIQVDSGSHNNIIAGNLSYGNGDHGIDNNTAPNQIIVGNTFQGNFTSGINLELNSGGATIQDNILVDNGLAPTGGRKPFNIYVDNTSYTGNTLDYNLYYLTSPYDQQIQWNTTGYTSVSAFHTATSQEANGFQADPRFVAPAPPASDPPSVTVGDYHLSLGSPAIDNANSGVTGEPTTDLDGNPRLDDTATPNTGVGPFPYYDRGAYEFQPGSYPPSVSTQAVSAIGQTGATGNGTIVSLGSDNPTQHGVVWATSANPTLANNYTQDGSISAPVAFASAITGLSPSTQYHVRAYATNNEGTSYGGDVTFTTAAGHADTYTSGSGNWVAPAGVTSVTVEVWGGGGRGSTTSGSGQFAGGGGGGGGYSKSVVVVVPTNSYPYAVGAGSSSTAAGGSSSFNTATVVANGGNSATSSSGASGAAAGTGTVVFAGGNGANGSTSNTYGGGGGSSAGTAAIGTNATNNNGATAPAGGGNGGNGKDSSWYSRSGNGSNGSNPGGAGGGAYRDSGSSSYTGGNGVNGQVRITYGLVAGSTTTSVVCGGGTPTVIYGASITCVATVAASSGTPTGTVSWVTSGTGSTFTTSPCTLASRTCSVAYTPTSVGTGSHIITATYSGDSNFSTSFGIQTLTITPKALTTSGLSVASSKVYDGTPSATVIGTAVLQASEAFAPGTSGDGKPYLSDSVSISGTPVGLYNSKDVTAAGSVTFSGLTLAGAQAGNYTLTFQSPASATITVKNLTMSGLSVPASKVYDGTTAAVVSGPAALQSPEATGIGTTSDGIPYIGDTVSISGTPLGTYNSKDVGAGTTVTFSGLSLAGGEAGDYALTIQSPASATITAKPLTMSGLSAPASKVYDGTPSAVVSGTGALTGSELAGTGTSIDGKYYTVDGPLSLSGVAVGTYNSKNVTIATTVTFGGLSLAGPGIGNYTLTNQTVPATITPKPITVTAITNAKLYDRTTSAAAIPTNSGVASGDTAAFIESYLDKNVGFGTKTLIPGGIVNDTNSGANYTYTMVNNTTGTITAYPIMVNAITNTKVYDGTTTAAAIPTNSGAIAGDIPAFIEAYTNKNIGTGNKTLVPSGIVEDGNGGANYNPTFNSFTTGTITIKPIIVTAITNTKIYDGTTAAAAIPTNSGLGTGDTANFIETYLDKNVGSGNKVLVPTGNVTDGNGGLNYQYTMNTFSSGSITVKPASVTAVNNSKTVGTPDPTLTTTNSGFIASELGVGKITFSATRAAGETVSTYDITPAADDAGSGMLGNYNVTLNHGTFTINAKLTPTVTVDCGTNAVTFGSSLSCTVSVVRPSGSGTPTGTVAWTTGGAGGFGATTPCTLSGSVGTATCSATYTPTAVGTGTHMLTATYSGDAEYATNNGNRNVTVNKANQATLTVVATPSTVAYGSTSALSTTGGSGTGAVTYNEGTSNGCSITGSTLSVTNASGTCNVTATKAADSNYNAITSAAIPVTLTKIAQATLTVVATPSTVAYGSTSALSTTGGSGTGAVTYSAGSSTGCSITGSTLSVTNASGTCNVTATKAADNNYTATTSAALPVPLTKAAQATLTAIATPSTVAYGSTSTLSTTGGSGTGAVTYDKGSSTGCSITGSVLSVIDPAGTCNVTATKAADNNYNAATSAALPVTLTKGAQATLTVVATPSTVAYGSTSALSTTGGSGTGAVTFSAGSSTGCSITGSTLSVIDPGGTCSVTATKAADNNYNAATSAALPVPLTKASQIITFGPLANKSVTAPDFTVSATASSLLPVSFTTTTSSVCTVTTDGTVSLVSVGTCTITAHQAGNSNYQAAVDVPQSFNVIPLFKIYMPIILR